LSNCLAVLSLFFSSYFVIRVLRPAEPVARVLLTFCLFTGQVAVGGYLLSAVGHLNDVRYWSLYGVCAATVTFLLALLTGGLGQPATLERATLTKIVGFPLITRIRQWSWYERVVLFSLLGTVAACGLVNLVIVLFTAPTNWDSMTCHLARVAYYLQHNSLAYYDANNYLQNIYQKHAAVLALYTYLVSARSENACQLVQYTSYWVALCGVYGISVAAGGSRKQALFAALVFGLLTECLLQAVTPQVDMLLAAYVSVVVYFLFAFRQTRAWKHLAFSGMAVGLAIGTKAAALFALPSVVVVALHCFAGAGAMRGRLARNSLAFVVSALLGCAVFALPSGYLENYRRFGNPIAPAEMWELRAFPKQGVTGTVREGMKNVLRLAYEFLSLDGMPPVTVVRWAQSALRFVPRVVLKAAGANLETPYVRDLAFRHFSYDRLPMTNEDYSYWGVLGFALIWVAVIASALGTLGNGGQRALSLAALVFLAALSFGQGYDNGAGRYFLTCAVFAVPAVGACLGLRARPLRAYISTTVIVGCASAVLAVVFRPDRTLFTIHYQGGVWRSVFYRDRIAQLMAHNRKYHEAVRRYEELVPRGATVAVWLVGRTYEYPFFGEKLTRRLIPLNVYGKGTQPIPANADYLVYVNGYPDRSAGDMHLGADWYLRHLGKQDVTPLRQ